MKLHDSETISFINKDLRTYGHVNANGSVCIHTNHNPVLKEKLIEDLSGLKQWINEYYLKDTKDSHYEHIIVSQNQNVNFWFTDIPYIMDRYRFGICKYSSLNINSYDQIKMETYIIQEFQIENESYFCEWSRGYKQLPKDFGIFVFIKDPPTGGGRFAIESWINLEKYVDETFLKFLHKTAKTRKSKSKFPLLIGYSTPGNEVHWECAIIDPNAIPVYAEKLGSSSYKGRLEEFPINWVKTKNCSYRYFLDEEVFQLRLQIRTFW